jgi:hypothetical protein
MTMRPRLEAFRLGGRYRRHGRLGVSAIAAALVFLLVACGGEDSSSLAKAAAKPDPSLSRITDKGYDRTKFSDSTTIDNKWFPLVPGTQFVFEGRSNRGQGRLPHRVIFTVTDLTKMIDGVRTRVMWDQDINAGKLLEAELAFFAQDDNGHVWAFGEYPEEYEDDGSFAGAPSTWIVGRNAKAGLHMRAVPRPNTPAYHH